MMFAKLEHKGSAAMDNSVDTLELPCNSSHGKQLFIHWHRNHLHGISFNKAGQGWAAANETDKPAQEALNSLSKLKVRKTTLLSWFPEY